MKYSHILGIDISKKTIDVALSQNQANANMLNRKFTNNLKGYQSLLVWLKKEKVELGQVLICLENTGIYHRSLVDFLQTQQAFIWVENAVDIKWSMGLQRGKNDKADAQRICLYAFRNQDKAKSYQLKDQALEKIADLLAARERLITAKNALLTPIKELKEVGLLEQASLVEKACEKSLSALEKEIKDIGIALETLVKQEQELEKNYNYIHSIGSVGPITALKLLVYTHNFKRFCSAKKLASYAGVAPFEYSSGTSIRGKTKVHPMANKELKTVLHMCALSAISHQGEMREYFDRKVKEGKNKMSVINAIRNKILHRIFACIRDQKMYELKQAA
jgi:transposase